DVPRQFCLSGGLGEGFRLRGGLDCLVGSPRGRVGGGEVVGERGFSWLETKRFHVVCDRVGELPVLGERLSKAVMRDRETGPDPHGLAVVGDRLRNLALLWE